MKTEGHSAKKVVLSLVMGAFLLLGGVRLFAIPALVYFSYLIHVLGNPLSLDWVDLGWSAVDCGIYYLVGFLVWILGRRKVPSLDKTGRKLFSVFLFVPGILLFLIIVISMVLFADVIETILTEGMWAHIGFGAIAFGLMWFAVLMWRRARTPKDTMECPHCHYHVPEGSDSCPQCGHQLKQDTQKSESG